MLGSDSIEARLIQRGSPFQLEDASIGGITYKVFPKGPQILSDLYRKAAAAAEREYIVTCDSRVNYGEVLSSARRLARHLEDKAGVVPGKHIAIVMPNCADWIISFIAITAIGAVVVAIHAELTPQEIELRLLNTDCVAVICDPERGSAISASRFRGSIIATGTPEDPQFQRDWLSHRALLAEQPPEVEGEAFEFPRSVPPDSLALIACTSGSSGTPKGVVLTHRNLVTGLMNMMLGGALCSARAPRGKPQAPASQPTRPCGLILAPLSHISGYAQMLLMMYIAGKIVLATRWQVSEVVDLVEKESVRSISGATPAMLRELVRAVRLAQSPGSLSSFFINGAALQGPLIRELMAAFPTATVSTGYGLTETCGSISVVAGADLLERPTTSGRVLPSVSIRLTNAAGDEVPIGEPGEISIRGAMVMQAYWGDISKTAEVLQDGWFRTGDLGRLDAAGHLEVIDRVQDIIASDGQQFSSTEIERALLSIERVDDAAVLGHVSIAGRDELLVAVVTDLLEADLPETHAKLRRRIPGLPAAVRLSACSAFPLTASGKVDRPALKRNLVQLLTASAVPTDL